MSVFVIAEIKVTDGSWVADYTAMVHGIVHRYGGRYLARSGKIETLEGHPGEADLIALIEFPSKAAAAAFAKDPAYAPFAAARRSGSDSRLRLIDDSDLAGTISYLPKG
jgi:uncharacterized protein (DUF1330 family)